MEALKKLQKLVAQERKPGDVMGAIALFGDGSGYIEVWDEMLTGEREHLFEFDSLEELEGWAKQ